MGTNAGGTTGLGNVMDLGVERRAWWGFCKRRQEKVFVMEAVRTCVREIAAATISGSKAFWPVASRVGPKRDLAFRVRVWQHRFTNHSSSR